MKQTKLKVLVDENCAYLTKWLQSYGWDVIDAKKGTLDPDIIKEAKEKKAILVTKDRGLEKACRDEGVPCYRLYIPPIHDAITVHRNLQNFKNIVDFYVETTPEAEEKKQ